MTTFRPAINPDILRWARERVGYEIAGVAEKLPKYPEWEAGSLRPTMRQIEGLAKRFRTPLGFFFLPEPPEITLPIPDFRTLGGVSADPSPDLQAVLDLMTSRQDWMREFLISEGEDPLPFVGTATVEQPVVQVAETIRETLGLGRLWAREASNYTNAVRTLRRAMEAVGILVTIAGYAGTSTHRAFRVEEFRGFVLSDPYAPLVFVNARDALQAQVFTLAHELAHVWIGRDALLDLPRLQPADDDTERFCDQVAAEFLVPATEFSAVWKEVAAEANPFKALAMRFRVSQIVAARRALDLGVISRQQFFDFYDSRQQAYEEERAARPSGGSFWNTQGTRIGDRFGRAVVRAVRDGRLLYTDAYRLTGLRAPTFETYAQRLAEA